MLFRSPHEIFPRGDWADDQIVAFFQDRFDSGGGWMSGLRTLLADGTYAERSNHYYAQTRARASELLGRTAILGRDVAFTEVVHCKSRKEAGVADALDECATRYLTAILAASPARVFIVAGRAAQSAFERAFSSVRVAEGLAGPIEIAGRQRMVAYLPHPSGAFGPRTFAACLPHGLPQLRRWLEGAPGLP